VEGVYTRHGPARELTLGAVLGIFLGGFMISVRRTASPLQGLWTGALALLALSIGYSLPIYHREISGLLRDSGLSSLKVSVADITLEATLAAKGSEGVVSASGGATGSPAQSVVRFTDPAPGIQALKFDFYGMDMKETEGKDWTKDPIWKRDRHYVAFLKEGEPSIADPGVFLRPVTLLAKCLAEYTDKIADSHLLLLDMRPIMSPLFLLHRNFQDQIKDIVDGKPPGDWSQTHGQIASYTPDDYKALRQPAGKTIEVADRALTLQFEDESNHSFHEARPSYSDACKESQTTIQMPKYTSPTFPHLTICQPYITIALASLLQAHGASDEAVNVLAEWLSSWERLQVYNRAHPVPEFPAPEFSQWYRIDVLARLQAILRDVAGTNNRAFRYVLKQYQDAFTEYLANASKQEHRLRLADIPARCADWSKGSESNGELRRKLSYILWGTEVDSLRTELNFIPEIDNYEELEELWLRSAAVTQIKTECLPQTTDYPWGTKDYRKAVMADGKVIAGLVALAVGDRMSALGKSKGDQNRASDARTLGEAWLIDGWADLRPIWDSRSKVRMAGEWPERIFGAGDWDKTATIALRVLSRLHQGE